MKRPNAAFSKPNEAVTLKALLAAGVFFVSGCGKTDEAIDYQVRRVQKGDLRISIRQKGTIEAKEPVKILNPIEGSSVILDLIPEGSFVKVGDRILDLDVSDARDKLLQQQISTSKAEQDFFNSEKQLEIQRQENESLTKKSELDVLFAQLDVKQYIEGDLPNEQRTSESEITLARAELERSKDTFTWSEKLFEKGYISSDKREGDRLQVKRRELELQVTQENLELLNKFTSVKKKSEFEAKLGEAERELIRANTKAGASEAQRVADVTGKRGQFDIENQKLQRLERQVANNVVRATADGLVVYAREGGGNRDSKPMEPGTKVHENQVLVTIPDMKRVQVDVDVHESVVQTVTRGKPVFVTTDTGEMLQGAVGSIASVPDSQSWYRNPDLKVYSTTVAVDNSEGKLKPGMNCYAEIIIEELKDVISVPVQSIHDNGEKTFCYVRKGAIAELREVKCGKHNGLQIHVIEGLSDGEDVYLAVPQGAPAIPVRKTTPTPVVVQAVDPLDAAPANEGEGRRGRGRQGEGGEGGRGRMTPDMLEKMKNMSPMEKMKNMSPEELEAMRKRMTEGGGRRGDGAGTGSGQGERGARDQ